MIEAMIDLETLGVAADAAVVQIAAVAFDGALVLLHYKTNVTLASDLGTIDAKTLQWWLEQDDRRFRSVVGHEGRHLKAAIDGLSEFLHRVGVDVTWACSPTFDHTILRYHAKRLGASLPECMSFRNERCFRTVRDIGRRLGVEPTKGAPTHDALQDCLDQHDLLVRVYEELGITSTEQTK